MRYVAYWFDLCVWSISGSLRSNSRSKGGRSSIQFASAQKIAAMHLRSVSRINQVRNNEHLGVQPHQSTI